MTVGILGKYCLAWHKPYMSKATLKMGRNPPDCEFKWWDRNTYLVMWCIDIVKQETAKDGMAWLQSGNKIWETDWEQA